MKLNDMIECGFKKTAENCYQLFTSTFTCTIIYTNPDKWAIYATGLTQHDNNLLTTMKYEKTLKEILDFISEKQQDLLVDDEENPGFDAEDEVPMYLPVLAHDKTRKITIITWGRKMRKAMPEKSQKNFNAAILNGKRKDINLKKLDGRSDDVQEVVSRCSMFASFICGVIENVEKNNLNCISVNCAKGRHRSVAGALLLKKYYYPNANVIHLELN